MNKFLDNIKKIFFSDKKRTIITTLALLIVSFGIGYFVLANDATNNNKYTVDVTSIKRIDGTPNKITITTDENGKEIKNEEWDTCTSGTEGCDAGNDSSAENGIVRNFDTMQYNISYKLTCKDGETCGTNDDRTVITYVYLPKGIVLNDRLLLNNDENTPKSSNSNINMIVEGYDLYEIVTNSVYTGENNIFEFSISFDVNTSEINNTDIIPKIYMYEATDKDNEDNKGIIAEDSKNLSDNNIKETENIKLGFKITAKENYKIKLYKGPIIKEETGDNANATMLSTGILLYIPNEGNKGVKGSYVPEKISIPFEISGETLDGMEFNDNTENGAYFIKELPITNTQNTNIGIGINENKDKIDFSKIKYTGDSTTLDGVEVPVITSKILTAKISRAIDKDKTITFKIGNESLTMVDEHIPYVGKYISNIRFLKKIDYGINEEKTYSSDNGQTMYNYGEEFYIENKINYADDGGDKLDNLTNYIKLDPNVVQLIPLNNNEDVQISVSNIANSSQTTNSYEVEYGYGEWKPENFSKVQNSPSTCPSQGELSKMSTDELMSLYGGPCIVENENAITWEESIDASKSDKKIILVRYKYTKDYYPATITTMILKAKIYTETAEVGKVTQIVSRGVGEFNENTYYLRPDKTSKEIVGTEADLKYIKSEYDVANKTYVKSAEPSFGDSILVVPFKSSFSTLEIKDSYDSNKSTIYSGITDPASIVIRPVIYKSHFNSTLKNTKITVYLPTALELDVQKGDKVPIFVEQKTIDSITYNIYRYDYTEDDIKYEDEATAGVIEELVVHAYVNISTPDETKVNIISEIEGSSLNNTTNMPYSDITPLQNRQKTVEMTIRNTRVIGALGKSQPSYLEKNGTITYNMRAANISGADADLSLLKILPYNGDGVGDGTSYEGSLSVKIDQQLPEGYQAYYTKDTTKNIYYNETNSSSTNNWTIWSDYTNSISGVTAIKITGPKIVNNQYFADPNGINITMTTADNIEGDQYYNIFYMIQTGKVKCDNELEGGCDSSTNSNSITPYVSNISYSSVYNRSISGYVFEDYDYNGLYSNDEVRLNDIPVEIYRLSSTSFDSSKSNSPLDFISDSDELVAESITDVNGAYNFKGLTAGNYYIKYVFNCDKYTVTEKNKKNETEVGDTSSIDSDADMLSGECGAISNIITLNNDNSVSKNNIDLGLRIRQNFDVTVKKYITNVVVNSTSGTNSYDYDNETKVKIDVKNPKNTTFRVKYNIVIENSKYFPGTIGQIVESIPEGMTFDPTIADNYGWYQSGDHLYYSNFARTYILPNEKYYITVVLDLKTDSGGDYINIVAAQDLKIMETTVNVLDGVTITDYNPDLDPDNADKKEEQ